MPTGDDMRCGRDNFADEGTFLGLDPNSSRPNPNNFLFKVDAEGTEIGILGSGKNGVQGSGNVAGVRGIASSEGAGVIGQGNRYGVEGLLTGADIPRNRIERAAVVGSAADTELGIGVMGISDDFQGVLGSSQSEAGVHGLSTSGPGVHGQSSTGPGVHGESTSGQGIRGDGIVGVIGFAKRVEGRSAVGVLGNGGDDVAVFGSAGLKGVGVLGASSDPTLPGRHGTAGVFLGALIVNGPKSAAVPHPDGSHRLLYSLESPESWFEDFGEGRLKNGKARIKLDRDFAKVVKTDKYHVFVTGYGDSGGLYVANRTNQGFEVREQQGGKGSLTFSYRVVARRKDIESKRLAKVTLPEVASLAEERKLSPAKPRSKAGKK